MSFDGSSQPIQGPPYRPTIAGVGGIPTVSTDVPILSVFLAFYIGAAIGNMTILQLNRRKGHKFLINAGLFSFCMVRILTCIMRISQSVYQANISLSIAANIFVNAGILVAYIVNLLLAQRILRARHSTLGWHRALSVAFKMMYALVAVALVLLIVFIVLSFYTLNAELRRVSRDIQLAALTYFLIINVLPFIFMALAFILPKSADSQNFGKGSLRSKALIVLVSTTLCLLNAGFKAGVNWETPRPLNNPAWYQAKAPFYIFYFVVEIILLYFFLAVRIDKRFHIPDGSSKRRTYAVPHINDRPKTAKPLTIERTHSSSEDTEKKSGV